MVAHREIEKISSDRLAMMYRLSQNFNACCINIDELINLIVDEVISVTQAERCLVRIFNTNDRCAIRVTRGLDKAAMHDPQFRFSRRVMGQVSREEKPILTENSEAINQLAKQYGRIELESRSILCVPLMSRERVTGLIYVDSLLKSGVLKKDDLDLLTTIAASAAVAIENARLHQSAVSNARLEREMQMAHDIQAGLLPQQTPQLSGWEFATHWQPAREVAGDYFDFISSDTSDVGLVIADVSDKGVPAALFMANVRTIIRTSVNGASSPAEAIERANRLICADATDGMFVTLSYAQINPSSGEITYVNAGHNPPLLYRSKQSQLLELKRTGMALGVDSDATYEQKTVKLASGEFIVFYTDGVTEAINDQNQLFGNKRLRQVLLDNQNTSAKRLVSELQIANSRFIGDMPSFDDIAILATRYLN